MGEALVESRRLQKQRLIRRYSEGPASLEERECVGWWGTGLGREAAQLWSKPSQALATAMGGFEVSLLSRVSVSGRNGHPHPPT